MTIVSFLFVLGSGASGGPARDDMALRGVRNEV